MELMKTFLIVCSVTALNKSILPRRPTLDRPMRHSQGGDLLLEGGLSLGMRRIPHRKVHGVIRHDEKKGGRRSLARWKTPAMVLEVASG